MKDFLQKYKLILIRSVGALLLLFGFVAHFWLNPKQGYSELDIAAANVARMEASVAPQNTKSQHAKKNSGELFADKYKETREKQIQYLTTLSMLFGVGFLIFSFLKRGEQKEL